MDVRIEAAAMEATADLVVAVVRAVRRIVYKAIVAVSQVASFSCPSIAGHSLSAVAPDHISERSLSLAA